MTTLQLELPHSIQRHLQELASADGVPADQFVASAVTEKVSALLAQRYLLGRAESADPAALQAVLDKVSQRPPLAGDE